MRMIPPPLFKNVGYLFHLRSNFNFILQIMSVPTCPTVQSIYSPGSWDGIPYYTWSPGQEVLSSTYQRGYDGGFSITPHSTGFGPTREILTPLWEMDAWVSEGDQVPTSGTIDSAREHPLYQASPQADGLYHCPWEEEASCTHRPHKFKCKYAYDSVPLSLYILLH